MECFRSEMAALVAITLLEMTPGYMPKMNKAEEMHESVYEAFNKCLDL